MLDRPVVGIVDTGSGFNNCHRTVPELIEAVKRGVLAAGGLPLAFPTVSLCEPSLFPTSMHYRNLAALDTEAMLTAQPMDAAVLVGGCDKTVPAQLMAAASADIPAVQLVTGPMLATPYQGERLSACTDCRRYWAAYRAGRVTAERIGEIEGRLAALSNRERDVLGTANREWLEFRGKRIAAWRWGRGPTILLAHGWSGRGGQLSAFVEPFERVHGVADGQLA